MKKINILFLVLSLNVGGTERHIYNLVSKLNKDKYNLIICCLFELGSIGEAIRENCKDIKVYHNLLKNKYDVLGLWRMRKVVREENVNILFTINSPITQFWAVILAGLSGAVCITRVASTNPTFHVRRRKIVNKLMLPFVDIIVAQAESHKGYLVNAEGMNEDKVRVVYNGVELGRFNSPINGMPLRKQLGLTEGDFVVGIVARLAPEKGHEIFIKAAQKVVDVFPNAHFLVVGDGKARNVLEDLARELSIELNVSFLGSRKDIPQLLSLLDIAVLSSYPVVETFSNAILEYMAAGKPVVATNAGSIADQVIDGRTGYLVPCGDSNGMASSIIHLLKHPMLLKEMGTAGRERIEEKFTLKKMIVDYENLFNTVRN